MVGAKSTKDTGSSTNIFDFIYGSLIMSGTFKPDS